MAEQVVVVLCWAGDGLSLGGPEEGVTSGPARDRRNVEGESGDGLERGKDA